MEKKNEINEIHIHNDINHINTRALKEVDLNVFFTICAMFKDTDQLSVKIPFDRFIELTGIQKSTLNTRKKFIDFADKKTKKLRDLEYYNKTVSKIFSKYVFSNYRMNKSIESKMLEIDSHSASNATGNKFN